MILLINICKERLHYYEFIKPIEDILRKEKIKYFIKDYREVNKDDLKKVDRVVICGTSLYDNGFIDNIERFNWLKGFEKPILGICGGMQIIGLVFGGDLKKKTEIGFYREVFKRDFLGLNGEQEVYHLHNNYIDFFKLKEFEVLSGDSVSQVVKHKNKEIYGVLFHPEVRQKGLILNFVI